MSKNFYLTTTLPYVNADPHIGFALEMVHADIIVRYRKLLGDEIFFNTGTDEHGLKIFRKAEEEKKEPQAYTDEYAARFRNLKEKLNLSDDLHFIRTTDAHHKKAAQEMWKRCLANGDIYKKAYKGLYCAGDEAFLKESELVDGKCPNHPTMNPVEIEEENYFFKLSAYQEKLLTYLSREGVIVPEWRRLEAVNFVKQGLEDFSISRVKEKMPWGVAVPGDDSQVMYVWFDALTNYISTLGWPEDAEGNFKKFWVDGETIQLAGKDQVRFQSIMWQAMLMSAGLPTTQKVVYHGFITSGGQKMSKSIGNVIDPIAIVDEYGIDALRYFLARHIHPFEDSDFTMERFKEAYNADLANGLGNLAARIMKLAEIYVESPANLVDRDVYIRSANIHIDEDIETFELNHVLDEIWSQIKVLDEAITKREPFKLVKENPEEGKAVILSMMTQLYGIGLVLEPFMPTTSQKIRAAVEQNKKPENLFPPKRVGMKYFDAHAHVNFVAYNDDREETIHRAGEAGVAMNVVGTQLDTSKAAVELAEKYDDVYATIGLHPIHTAKSYHDEKELGEGGKAFTSRGEVFDVGAYEALARSPRVIAIGECGLDYYRCDESTKELQKKVFIEHIELANKLEKPLMLHIRDAYDDALEVLKAHAKVKGDVHFFAGDWATAKKFLDFGFTLSFTGVVTFTHDYDEVVKNVPLDMLLSETDAPYVTPVPHRGKRNEPAHVIEVVRGIAKIRGEDFDEVAAVLCENARRVFRI